jgi:hypothetical protein
MASKRRIRRKECGDKQRYSDSKQAKTAAFLISRKTGEKLHSYDCKFCNGWHVGHPPINQQHRLGFTRLLRDFK